LARLTTTDLLAEVERRQASVDALHARRELLAGELAALDQELSALGSAITAPMTPQAAVPTPKRRRRKRRRGKGGFSKSVSTPTAGAAPKRSATSLADALRAVLTGKSMTVAQATAAVLAAGYETTSANFAKRISNMLLENRARFHRVSRGLYSAR